MRANVDPKDVPSRCLNPRATNLDFAFTYPTKLIGLLTEQPLRVNDITYWLLRGAERVGLQ